VSTHDSGEGNPGICRVFCELKQDEIELQDEFLVFLPHCPHWATLSDIRVDLSSNRDGPQTAFSPGGLRREGFSKFSSIERQQLRPGLEDFLKDFAGSLRIRVEPLCMDDVRLELLAGSD
jgi:hypothetical protein